MKKLIPVIAMWLLCTAVFYLIGAIVSLEWNILNWEILRPTFDGAVGRIVLVILYIIAFFLSFSDPWEDLFDID